MRVFLATILAGLRKLPDLPAAVEGLALFLLVIGSGAAFVYGAGWPFTPGVVENTAWLWAFTFFPALTEELVFRGWLRRGMRLPAVASLLAFILWHPLQVLIGSPFAKAFYMSPLFLPALAVLALACSISRVRSGSIWPAVIIHWGAMVAWSTLLAG